MAFQINKKCDACRKRKLYIAHRTYKPSNPNIPPITSNGMLCNKCARAVRKMIKSNNY